MKLRELRTERNLTLKQLSDQIKMSPQVLSRYERGDREPDIKTLFVLADFFGCSIDYLLDREDDFGNVSATSGTDDGAVAKGLDEKRILKTYRLLSARDKEVFMRFLSTLNLSQADKK